MLNILKNSFADIKVDGVSEPDFTESFRIILNVFLKHAKDLKSLPMSQAAVIVKPAPFPKVC